MAGKERGRPGRIKGRGRVGSKIERSRKRERDGKEEGEGQGLEGEIEEWGEGGEDLLLPAILSCMQK